jgi:membrane protein DedA with SNARE-associated domain
MINYFVTFITNLVFPFGALGVFFAEFIEEVIVPIPSAMILLGSGFVFLKGDFWTLSFLKDWLFVVVLPATLGLTMGSVVIYKLVYIFESSFISKFGKVLSISQKDIDNMNERLNSGRFDEFFIVLARIIPVVPSVLLAVFCGIIKMPIKKYLTLTFIGAFFRSLLLSFVGFLVGDIYTKYADKIGMVENTVFVLVIVSVVVFIIYRKFYKDVV